MIKPMFAALAGWTLIAASPVVMADPKTAKEDVVWPADAIKWEDGPIKGTHVAKLWGDWQKAGNFGNLVKFDAGLMHALHHHTTPMKLVIVSGTLVYQPEGGTETKLGPGSYLFEAKKHVSGCTKDADCVFFLTSSGKFDLIDDSGKKDEGAKKE